MLSEGGCGPQEGQGNEGNRGPVAVDASQQLRQQQQGSGVAVPALLSSEREDLGAKLVELLAALLEQVRVCGLLLVCGLRPHALGSKESVCACLYACTCALLCAARMPKHR